MCVIITIIMLGFAIQNLMVENWLAGGSQLLIALAFLLLLINNLRRTRAERTGQCYNGCSITNWIGNLFKKKESQ
ncbi:hypothetical protein KKC13_00765 [bacterium]|nr:hypothetical protein [bacterium]MBU1957790.1 hypothetical protein [bacterium]